MENINNAIEVELLDSVRRVFDAHGISIPEERLEMWIWNAMLISRINDLEFKQLQALNNGFLTN